MKNISISFVMLLFLVVGCQSEAKKDKTEPVAVKPVKKEVVKKTMADAATILAKKEVPVLCYHHIKNIQPGDSEYKRAYTVTPEAFAEQMKTLSENGFHTISPDQLYDYLAYDVPLPAKPVMLTFDDTNLQQYTVGAAEMKKYGFKGVFFIMTVSINRPNYMTKEMIKELADDGHEIAAHTWDHHMVTKYSGEDWNLQFAKPKKKLEDITGKPLKHFAYPFGLWNQAAIPQLKEKGYKMAFILATKRDTLDPLYTVRRILVPSSWSTAGMLKAMESSFH
ncbi:polysaccharide deacetylase family protein [Flavobacterium sp. GT3R68]|uniref:polysaccharide deacetylase family protein n=1 Tax=Flavobacterium sp. GT3R68 TaxID=2594437 RepID=UPI000F866AEB|nr:polysaccharide deacetylase family protein [Flavobacterium sp. GT3R68]RTY96029.1 polysaccharide deacetylase family protein [Flavobacterium sp. GSN2]TRW93802.1 polysaccharide deacetylase family protein [Flavobacterium sp. GT3R68]